MKWNEMDEPNELLRRKIIVRLRLRLLCFLLRFGCNLKRRAFHSLHLLNVNVWMKAHRWNWTIPWEWIHRMCANPNADCFICWCCGESFVSLFFLTDSANTDEKKFKCKRNRFNDGLFFIFTILCIRELDGLLRLLLNTSYRVTKYEYAEYHVYLERIWNQRISESKRVDLRDIIHWHCNSCNAHSRWTGHW